VKGSWDATHNHQLFVITASVAPNPAGSPQEIRDDLEVVSVRDVRHVHQLQVYPWVLCAALFPSARADSL